MGASAYWPPRRTTAPAASTSGQPEVHCTLVLGVSQTVLAEQPDAVEYWRKSSKRSRRSCVIPAAGEGVSDLFAFELRLRVVGTYRPSRQLRVGAPRLRRRRGPTGLLTRNASCLARLNAWNLGDWSELRWGEEEVG